MAGLRARACDLTCPGAVFPGARALNWLSCDFTPGPMFFQDDFVPAPFIWLAAL